MGHVSRPSELPSRTLEAMTAQRHPNADRLAEAISARRTAQRWSYVRVSKNGGPTKPTQIAYERGEIPVGVLSTTLEKFDTGLGWEPGTALSILGGGAVPDPHTATVTQLPVPEKRDTTPPPAKAPVEEEAEEEDVWAIPSAKLRKMLKLHQELRHQVRDLHLPSDVREVVEEVTAIQNEILMDRLSDGPQRPRKGTAPRDRDDGEPDLQWGDSRRPGQIAYPS